MSNKLRILEIKKEFLEDVITDFNESNNNLFNELSHNEREWIITRVNSEIDRIITFATNEFASQEL